METSIKFPINSTDKDICTNYSIPASFLAPWTIALIRGVDKGERDLSKDPVAPRRGPRINLIVVIAMPPSSIASIVLRTLEFG